MPLYLLRPGTWFRFVGGYTLYEQVAVPSRDLCCNRFVGCNIHIYHDGGMAVEIHER